MTPPSQELDRHQEVVRLTRAIAAQVRRGRTNLQAAVGLGLRIDQHGYSLRDSRLFDASGMSVATHHNLACIVDALRPRTGAPFRVLFDEEGGTVVRDTPLARAILEGEVTGIQAASQIARGELKDETRPGIPPLSF